VARLPAAGKTIAVVLALVLAVVATSAIAMYVRGVEARAFEDAELVEVFVAQGPIDAGTPVSAAADTGLIARDVAPRGNVPVGAVTSLDQLEGQVAVDRVLEGEILLAERWGTTEQASVGFEIPEGFEAIAVEVDIPPGVAGYIRAGDRISVIATVEVGGTTTTDADGNVTEEAGDMRSQYLLQAIEVLAVGQRTTEAEGDQAPQSSVLATLAVEPEAAEKLVFAVENGTLYFTLLPEDAEPQETPGRTLDDLFS
jgi:pilus assembly protein CpaB